MKEKLLTTVENSRKYSIAVASAMPENGYDFRPSPDVWNFKELINHIAYGIIWWQKNYLEKVEIPWDPPAILEHKTDIVNALNQAYDALAVAIGNVSQKDDLIIGFQSTLDHITHHRGQATVYLRCKGVTPPEYTF